ncbi:MAG TPA: hypothetical protein VJU84_05460 [Pyrinomonadaceae bacterium]|nr:hypothetical protein [Pyrinomonadaceae bacterium]
MFCKILRHANPVMVRNVLFTSAMLCQAIIVSGCAQGPAKQNRAEPGWIIEVLEAEHKTVQHPEKKYYATIQPDGLQVSFHTAQGHFGSYTFPARDFPLGEPVFLLCPGSPDLLPMRVVLIKGDSNDSNDYHDYMIEWLDKPPATPDGAKVVRSY